MRLQNSLKVKFCLYTHSFLHGTEIMTLPEVEIETGPAWNRKYIIDVVLNDQRGYPPSKCYQKITCRIKILLISFRTQTEKQYRPM